MDQRTNEAERLIQSNFVVVPYFREAKHNKDKEVETRAYTIKEINSISRYWDIDGNLGLNLFLSKLLDFDLENKEAIYFAEKWCPDTLTLGREYPNGKREITHYFYSNDEGLEEGIQLDKSIAEFRVKGHTLVYGKAKNKITKEMMTRYWGRTISPSSIPADRLKKIFRKISFAAWLAACRSWSSANEGALKLDACLKRYTDWSYEERFDFLKTFYHYVLPSDHRDLNDSKFHRIVKSNDRQSKNAGYNSFAEHCGLKPNELKLKFQWIGSVPQDETYQKTLSRRDFRALGIDMIKLRGEDIPPLNYVVEPILPEGLVLWAGRPKAMKSWTALDLTYCVENGLNFLNHKVQQGSALYLALEDSKRRLKDREAKLSHNNRERAPTVDVDAPYLGFGLEESIADWINTADNPKVVVIDTLARVKQTHKQNKNATAYDLDNELLRKLQKTAIENRVCIILITHLAKQNHDYNFDRITGSAGLQGIADCMWLIDRGESNKGSFTGRGRDILDFEFAVQWDDSKFRYEYLGDKKKLDLQENRLNVIKVMEYLKKDFNKTECTPGDVYKYYGYKPNSSEANNISRTMTRMRKNYELESGSKFGTYKLVSEEHNHF